MGDPMIETPRHRSPRIALAHDWLCGYRGGEAVLERLAVLVERLGTAAGLYVMFDDGRPLSSAVDRWRGAGLIHASTLNGMPFSVVQGGFFSRGKFGWYALSF